MASTKANWIDEYQQHGCWGQLEGIMETSSNVVPADAGYIDQLDRIRLVASVALELRDASPIFVPSSTLVQVEQSASAVHTPLASWKSEDYANDAYIAQAFAQLPALQGTLGNLPTPASTSLRSAAATLRNVVTQTKQYVETLSSHVDEFDETHRQKLEEHLATAQEGFEALQTKMEAVESAIDSKVASSEQRVINIDAQLTSIEKRSNDVVESIQRQYQTAEENRTTAHTKLTDKHEKALTKNLEDSKADLSKHLTDEEARIAPDIKRIEQLKVDAEKTVGAIGVQATAKWYKENADEQRSAANMWRRITTTLFIVAFAVVGWSVFLSGSESESWKSTVLKSTTTATLVAGAIYAQSESKKHREEEFKSKTTELTLRALDPFIATLGNAQRSRLRTEAARQVFFLKPEYQDDYEVEEMDDELNPDA